MYPRSLKGIKWAVLCYGLTACTLSFGAVTEQTSHPLTNKCLPESYPPPPEDKSQLPEPVKSCIQMIVDLCQQDKNGGLKLTLGEQVPVLKSAIKGLRQALPYYINSGQVDSLNLRRIRSNLFSHVHIIVFWEPLWDEANKGQRMDIAQQFLKQRAISYNLESDTGPERFSHDWQHQIYEGLYCVSHGKLPPASSFPVKTM